MFCFQSFLFLKVQNLNSIQGQNRIKILALQICMPKFGDPQSREP